ncbi:hypothetical protein TNCV_882701 [Trichonephila clavipes]|nr:hypothetical protein TNCV_882701 [Trichonephila clavipes]
MCNTETQDSDFSSFTCGTSYEEAATSATNDSPCSYIVLLHSRYCPSIQTAQPNLTLNKADAIPEELKSCALETIEERYPAN